MDNLKNKLKKYYSVLSPTFSILLGGVGLVLSVFGLINNESNKVFFIITLIIAQVFLVFSTIYSVVIVFKNDLEDNTLLAKKKEIQNNHEAIRLISENNRSIITTYKDFIDKLGIIKEQYIKTEEELKKHYGNHLSCPNKEETITFIKKARNEERNQLKKKLISNYNRLLSSITNLLRQSIEQYFISKGYDTDVSIAIKQLQFPTSFSNIDRNNTNVYTAFRDTKSYNKKRKETWEKTFKIKKNSAFIMSISKGYYIFNQMNKKYLEDGLYQNENAAFYEEYNSGITCTIHSCVKGNRILFGYLACDSLFDTKNNQRELYDWNVANIMMLSANIISSYIHTFLQTWNELYMDWEEDIDIWYKQNRDDINHSPLFDIDDEKTQKNSNIRAYNFCKVMKDSVDKTRYNTN